MWWIRISAPIISLDEGDDIVGRDPRRAEPRGDVGGPEIGGLHLPQRRDVALDMRDRARPRPRRPRASCGPRRRDRRRRSARTRRPDRGRWRSPSSARTSSGIAMQQLGDVIGIDTAALVEHDGERVGGGGDDRRRRRRDHPLGEDRARPAPCRSRGRSPRSRRPASNRDRRGRAARFGRRWVSRTSPVSGSSVVETTVWLIGPKSRTKLDQAMRKRTCASFHGWSSSWRFSTSRTASRIGISFRMIRACLSGMPSALRPLRTVTATGRRRRSASGRACAR